MAADKRQVTQDASADAVTEAKTLARLWQKVNEDWVLNFSGMLAYNYLTALAPIVLALVAVGGFALGLLSPDAYASFVQSLSSRFPPGLGQTFINAAIKSLRQSAGALLIIALVVAIFSGSRLFVALENVFAVIYRVDVRPLIRQNVTAILMMLLFLVLAPFSFFAGSLPGFIFGFLLPSGVQRNGFVDSVEGFAGGLLVAFMLFAAIYFIVPNRVRAWRTTWPGALTASVLLNLYEILFPIYQRLFLARAGLGSAAGLAVVILIFLYYIGFITLLGAEINTWVEGMRPLGKTLPELFRRERPTSMRQPLQAGGSQRAAPAVRRPHESRSSDGAERSRSRQRKRRTTRKVDGGAGGKSIQRIAGPAAAVTTVGAMLGAGVALALRRMSRPAARST